MTHPKARAFASWIADFFKVHFARWRAVALERFEADLLGLRAKGLTYTTLLSLVPFLAVTFSVLKAFGVQNQIEPVLARALEPIGPGGVEITSRIIEFVDKLELGGLGAAGVAGLFYTTISLISQVEDSLNHIWRARRPRSFGQKFSDYLSVVLVGPVLVFTALALIASAQSHWLMQAILAIKPLGFFVPMVTRIMPLVLLCAVFTFVYRFIPHTQVRFSSALLGGVVAGVLWQLIGIAFAALVASSTQYEAIYSSFAVLILFLLWIHTGWLILLAGGEVAYLHQHRAVRLAGVSYSEPSHVLRERLGILMLVEITRRYLACEPPWRAPALAIALGAPLYLLEELIDGLVQRGVLLRTTEPEGIALGWPPEQLSVSEIIELLGAPLTMETVDAGQDPVTRLLQRRDEAVRQATQGITLRSLAAETEGVSWAPMPSAR